MFLCAVYLVKNMSWPLIIAPVEPPKHSNYITAFLTFCKRLS